MNFKHYWSTQTSSGQRNTSNLLRLKAKEHTLLISGNNIIDIGCGAGELLQELVRLGNPINNAIDFSESMINEAKNRIKNTNLSLEVADTFDYLKNADNDIWICTQSVNQYLNKKDLEKLILLFRNNIEAQSFIMFDNIDPIKFYLWKHGIINTNNTKNLMITARKLIGLMKLGTLMLINIEHTSIGAMGHAYSPAFFFNIAKKMNFTINIYNSMFYEYRYHIEIQKKPM